MGRIRAFNKFFLFISAAFLVCCFSGCQKMRDIYQQPSGEVVHNSYPIDAYAYRMYLVVHASPDEFIEHFAKNMLWLERHADALQVDTGKMDPYTDMTVVGNSTDISVKILGVYLPFKLVCLRYKPVTTLWWMMVLTNDSWILIKFDFSPAHDGCAMKIEIIGQYSKYLAAIAGGFQAVEAFAYRADLIMTLNQSDFDPQLDVEKITRMGLRGELYETFLQGYESSVRIEAKPQEIIDWFSDNPDAQCRLLPNLLIDRKCIGANRLLFGDPEELAYCLSTYDTESEDIPAQVLSKGGWKDEKATDADSNYFWIIVLDTLMKVRMDVGNKGRGSYIRFISAVELPESEAVEAMDLMMGITHIPRRTEEILLDIKAHVEGSRMARGGPTCPGNQ